MRTFREFANYGFDDKEPKKPEVKPEDELPIQSFAANRLMDHLAREKVGGLQVLRKFEDQVQWGSSDGAVRARLTPNQGISIERLTTDLRGTPLWVTKKLFKVKSNEYAGREDTVANEIGQHIKDVSAEQIDSPTRDYKELYLLTKTIANRAKGHIINMFRLEEIKKVNEHNFNILFSVLGGVGRLSHTGRPPAYTPAGIIDMSYDPERGSIKGIFSTIDIQSEGGGWRLDVPYFMGEFTGSQPIEEIVHTMINGIIFI